MKFNFPTRYAGITVGQLVRYKAGRDDIERVMAITALSLPDARKIAAASVTEIIEAFEEVLANEELADSARIIEVEGKEFGIIPNFTRITYGEHVDLQNYSKDFYKYASHIMAMVYRPITERVGQMYRIEDYDPARSEMYRPLIEREVTLDQMNWAMLFFSTIANELTQRSPAYSLKMLNKAMREVIATYESESVQ